MTQKRQRSKNKKYTSNNTNESINFKSRFTAIKKRKKYIFIFDKFYFETSNKK